MKQAPRKVKSPPEGSPHRATVAAGFVTGLLAGIGSRGLERESLVRDAGMPPEVLSDARVRVPIASYVALYNAVVAALGDEGFGLFSTPLRRGSFEFLCRVMLGSADLREALDRGSRYLRVVLPDLRLSVTDQGTQARIEISETRPVGDGPDDPRRVFAFEWLLRLVHGVSCWLVARPLSLAEVRFPFARPAHADDYALIYTERSSFGARALVAILEGRVLELPVRREQADLAAFLEGGPGKISVLYRRDRDTTRAVREFVASALASSPSLEDAARALGLSARTLHRRLREEGASFRQIKDAVRRDVALLRLRQADTPIAELAAELGYSEPSAFFRAFHGWTGEAPSVHRRKHAGRRR